MQQDPNRSCVDCGRKACRKSEIERYPEFCLTKNAGEEEINAITDVYMERENQKVMQADAKLQAETYGTITRVEETILLLTIGRKSISMLMYTK